jgi:alkylation response protein AidB-like acyl-CoA dehydrogenase
MSLYETQQHRDLRLLVRNFAENEVKPVILELDEKEVFSVDLVKKMGQLGLLGMHISKKYGGRDQDYLAYIIAVEELARIDSSVAATLAAHNSLGIGPIYEYGTEDQKNKYLPGLCSGEKIWAFGLTEKHAGSDSQGVETRAELMDGRWHINGAKTFITNSASEISAGVTIEAITGVSGGKNELSAILVDRETEGFSRKPIKGKFVWRAIDNGELFFNNCQVPEENLLGRRGEGTKIMLKTLDSGRLSIAAIGLGLAQGAYEMAMAYARKRKQFGRPIIDNQVIAFKLSDMATKIELARNTLYHSCKLRDNGLPFSKEAAMIKLYTSEIAREIADESLQIHGAVGLLHQNHIERFYRDQRLLQIGEGTSEILRLVISRNIIKEWISSIIN